MFSMLDAHIYKSCGQQLEAAASLVQFVKQTIEGGLTIDSYWLMNQLLMAQVLLLSTAKCDEPKLSEEDQITTTT